MMKKILILAVATILGGCVAQQQPINMRNDGRTGSDQTPYRSIPAVLICDGCK